MNIGINPSWMMQMEVARKRQTLWQLQLTMFLFNFIGGFMSSYQKTSNETSPRGQVRIEASLATIIHAARRRVFGGISAPPPQRREESVAHYPQE
jgi:hypothetical protein